MDQVRGQTSGGSFNGGEQTELTVPSQKEMVSVYLRVKPRTKRELAMIQKSTEEGVVLEDVIRMETEDQVALIAPKESQTYKNSINGAGKLTHRYTFTKIFQPNTEQSVIFSVMVKPRVKDFLEGRNQLIFTYGATSSGKTYTFQGTHRKSGILPRALDVIFNTIGEKLSPDLAVKPTEFNGVMAIESVAMETLQQEKESVYNLGLELRNVRERRGKDSANIDSVSINPGLRRGKDSSNPDSMTRLPTSSGLGDSLDVSRLISLLSGLADRDREEERIEISQENINYSIWVSFAEIYNEDIQDLLQKVTVTKKKRPSLKLCDDKSGNTYVKGLMELRVNSADEAYQALMIGRENLHLEATKLNKHSSRSHCIFTIKVIRVADPTTPHIASVSLLSFCDLAGIERISKTHNVGDRLREANSINTSLLVLGRCISTIRHNQTCKDKRSMQVVPYRESKLTRLFRSSFTGSGRCSLIVCISQDHNLFDESVNVCKFASIANKVTVETAKVPRPKLSDAKKVARLSRILSNRTSPMTDRETRNQNSTFVQEEQRARVREAEGGHTDTEGAEPFEGLVNLVEDLKNELLTERRKNSVLEQELRTELVEEFNKMLVEVEGSWETRLKEEKTQVEKMLGWRLIELENVLHRNNSKRRRREDEEDVRDELIISQLQTKLEEAIFNVDECNKQIQAMKEAAKYYKEDQERLQATNSKLQFELAEQRRYVSELRKNKFEVKDATLDEETDKLEIKLREELSRKEKETMELKGLLEEAGDVVRSIQDDLKAVEEEISKKDVLLTRMQLAEKDIKIQLQERDLLLRDFNDRLEEKEARIEKMEQELEAKSGLENVVEHLKRRLSFVENELEIKEIQNREELKQISTRENLRFPKEHIGAKRVEENIIVKEFEQSNLSREETFRSVEISDWKQKFGMKIGNIEGRKNELDELIEDINDNSQYTNVDARNHIDKLGESFDTFEVKERVQDKEWITVLEDEKSDEDGTCNRDNLVRSRELVESKEVIESNTWPSFLSTYSGTQSQTTVELKFKKHLDASSMVSRIPLRCSRLGRSVKTTRERLTEDRLYRLDICTRSRNTKEDLMAYTRSRSADSPRSKQLLALEHMTDNIKSSCSFSNIVGERM